MLPGPPLPLKKKNSWRSKPRPKSLTTASRARSPAKTPSGAASGIALKDADALSSFSAAKDLAYARGKVTNKPIASENRMLEGKTFHLAGDLWIDDEARDEKGKEIEKLKFASKEYFDFLEKHPELIKFLSLGANATSSTRARSSVAGDRPYL